MSDEKGMSKELFEKLYCFNCAQCERGGVYKIGELCYACEYATLLRERSESSGRFNKSYYMGELMIEFNRHCCYCGLRVYYSDYKGRPMASPDHMIPRSRGGGIGIANLVLSCWNCNNRKHDMTSEEYLYYLENGEWAASYKDYHDKKVSERRRSRNKDYFDSMRCSD